MDGLASILCSVGLRNLGVGLFFCDYSEIRTCNKAVHLVVNVVCKFELYLLAPQLVPDEIGFGVFTSLSASVRYLCYVSVEDPGLFIGIFRPSCFVFVKRTCKPFIELPECLKALFLLRLELGFRSFKEKVFPRTV